MGKKKTADVMAQMAAATRSLDLSELGTELLSAFGGAKEFAANYHKDYSECEAGSGARIKMAQGVLSLLVSVSAQMKSVGTTEEHMTDEDIKDALEGLLGKK